MDARLRGVREEEEHSAARSVRVLVVGDAADVERDLADQVAPPRSVESSGEGGLEAAIVAAGEGFVLVATAAARFAPAALATAVAALQARPSAAAALLARDFADATPPPSEGTGEGIAARPEDQAGETGSASPADQAMARGDVASLLLAAASGAGPLPEQFLFRRAALVDAFGPRGGRGFATAAFALLARHEVAFVPEALVRTGLGGGRLSMGKDFLGSELVEDFCFRLGGGAWASQAARLEARARIQAALRTAPGDLRVPAVSDTTATLRGALSRAAVGSVRGGDFAAAPVPGATELRESRAARRAAQEQYDTIARAVAQARRACVALACEPGAATAAPAEARPAASAEFVPEAAFVVVGASARAFRRALRRLPQNAQAILLVEERGAGASAHLAASGAYDILLVSELASREGWDRAIGRTRAERVVFLDGSRSWDWPVPDPASHAETAVDGPLESIFGRVLLRDDLLRSGGLSACGNARMVTALPPPDVDLSREASPEAVRVALMVSRLDSGGLESVVRDLAIGLSAHGCLPLVICEKGGGRTAEILRAAGVPVFCLGENDPVGELALLLDQLAVDVLATHDAWSGVALAVVRDIPVVAVLHNEYGWLGAGANDPMAVLGPLISGYIAVSESVRTFHAARFAVAPERIAVVRNAPARRVAAEACPGRAQARVELRLDQNEKILISVGRIEPVKSQILLVEAFARRLQAGLPGRLLLVGGVADPLYAERLRARIAALDLDAAVQLLGVRDDIPRLLAASDLFVLPSLFEGLSLAAAEALQAGLPAVLSPTGDADFLLGLEAGGAPAGVRIERPAADPHRPDLGELLGRAAEPDEEQIEALDEALARALAALPALTRGAVERAEALAGLLDPARPVREHAALLLAAAAVHAPSHLPVAQAAAQAARESAWFTWQQRRAQLRRHEADRIDTFRLSRRFKKRVDDLWLRLRPA
jgi:glycosyltransferase involved in cell wall biosynthesis